MSEDSGDVRAYVTPTGWRRQVYHMKGRAGDYRCGVPHWMGDDRMRLDKIPDGFRICEHCRRATDDA